MNRTSDGSEGVCSPLAPVRSDEVDDSEPGSELGGGGGARPFGIPADVRTAGGGGITGGGGILREFRIPSGDPGRPERRVTCTDPSPGLGGSVSGGGGMVEGGGGRVDGEDGGRVVGGGGADEGKEEDGMVVGGGGGTATAGDRVIPSEERRSLMAVE